MAGGQPDMADRSRELSMLPDQAPRTSEQLKQHLKLFRENPNDDHLLVEIGRDYLYLANTDKWHFLDQSANFLKQVVSRRPNDPVVLIYLGRAVGARALNQKPSTMTRLKWAREGFRHMDKAVKLDQNSFYLRLLRGEAQLMAHPILRRGARLDEDHRSILNYMEAGTYEQLPAYQKARTQLFLGNYYQHRKKRDKAFHHWEQVVKVAEGTPFADEAKDRLKGSFKSVGFEE